MRQQTSRDASEQGNRDVEQRFQKTSRDGRMGKLPLKRVMFGKVVEEVRARNGLSCRIGSSSSSSSGSSSSSRSSRRSSSSSSSNSSRSSTK